MPPRRWLVTGAGVVGVVYGVLVVVGPAVVVVAPSVDGVWPPSPDAQAVTSNAPMTVRPRIFLGRMGTGA